MKQSRLPEIPAAIRNALIPADSLSVNQFLRFRMPQSELSDPLALNLQRFKRTPSSLTPTHVLLLSHFPCPSPSDLAACIKIINEAGQGEYQSFEYPTPTTKHTPSTLDSSNTSGSSIQIALPLYAFTYWTEIMSIREKRAIWSNAATYLAEHIELDTHAVLKLLDTIPWNQRLPRAYGDHATDLAVFLSQAWYHDIHIDITAAVINDSFGPQTRNRIVRSCHQQSMIGLWRKHRDTYRSQVSGSASGLGIVGHAIGKDKYTYLGFCFCVTLDNTCSQASIPTFTKGDNGNHWVAVVVDLSEKRILYGDPKGANPPPEIYDILRWWLGHHVDGDFETGTLTVPCQQDSFSCGALSMNALAHFMDPEANQLISTPSMALQTRLNVLHSIVTKIQSDSDNGFTTGRDGISTAPVIHGFTPQLPSTGVFTPREVKSKPAKRPHETSAHDQAVKRLRSIIDTPKPTFEQLDSIDDDEPLHNARHVTSVDGKAGVIPDIFRPRAKNTNNESSKALHAAASEKPVVQKKLDKEGSEVLDANLLVDAPAPLKDPKRGGRPPDPRLEALTVRCYYESEGPEKIRYRCIGEGCGHTWAMRNIDRVLQHITDCTIVDDSTKEWAREISRENAQSNKAVNANGKQGGEKCGGSGGKSAASISRKGGRTMATEINKKSHGNSSNDGEKEGGEVADEDIHEVYAKVAAKTDFFKEFVAKGIEERKAAADFALVKLVASRGLPGTFVESIDFHDFCHVLRNTYELPTRDDMEKKFIPSEANEVRALVYELLQQEENLTVSCDGGTAKNHEAFWNIHVSTEARKVYLVEGIKATAVSHTAEWIAEQVLKVIRKIGPEKFASTVSDSTGNTRGHRNLVEDILRYMFNLPDICHHKSNTIKEVTEISYFDNVVSIVRGVIAKFHRSHIGIEELTKARLAVGVSRGLEAVGKTRFGTVIRAAVSVRNCIPAIQRVVQNEKFDLGEFARYFPSEPTRVSQEFELELNQLISVCWPFLKALTCLEANEATTGDVCIYWHAAIFEVENVLKKYRVNDEIPEDTVEEIFAVLCSRDDELFGDGRISSAKELYYAGLYLDPIYLRSSSDIFKTDAASPEAAADIPEGIRHPLVFERIGNFLWDVAKNEVQYGNKQVFTMWRGKAGMCCQTLLSEFAKYSRQQYPYNEKLREGQTAFDWWKSIVGPGANILPHVARKIFAVRVNSMAEERTVSNYTWLSPPLKNKIEIPTMVRLTQIRQFYATGRNKARHGPLRTPRMLKFTDAREMENKKGFIEPEVPDPTAHDHLWPEDPETRKKNTKDKARMPCLMVRQTSLLDFNSRWLAIAISEKPQDNPKEDPSILAGKGSASGEPAAGEDNDFDISFTSGSHRSS